jgi:beta-carotene ketolase (CrtW type)
MLIFPNQEENFNRASTIIRHELSLIIAFFIIGLWTANTFICFHSNLKDISLLRLLILILGQTFLNTGLFITAHDAMHGLLCPFNLRLNNFIGSATVILYGLFSYQKLKEQHLLHHHFPSTALDPDYYHGDNSHFLAWYGHFMRKYISWQQLSQLSLVVLGITYFGNISWLNLILCWAFPLILSSLQLFTFGTFLPHRRLQTDP